MSEPLTPWSRGSGCGPRQGLPWFACIAVAALIAPAGAAAQATTGSVTGRVVEADGGGPVVAAAVRLLTAADTTVVTSAATGYRGHFRIAGVAPGRYFLEISRLGYAPRVTVSFDVADGLVYDLGVVELPVRALDLEPISVVEARPVVVYEPDRTSYLLEGLPSAEGGTISDALRDLPELDVDLEGNVELRGERPAIWLNGRPAPVTGQSLAQFLEQFPADLIERIEVIENPGSEFDAEGAGGIINIVLREGADLGLSGQLFANGDTRGNAGLGGRATLQRGDWVWDGSGALSHRDQETGVYSLRQNLAADPADFVERDSWHAQESLGTNVSLRATYTPRAEARYWIGANLTGQGGDRVGLVTTTHMDELRDPGLRYDRAILSTGETRSLNLRTGFEWRWEPRRHALDLELRFGRGTDETSATEERTTRTGDEEPPTPLPNRLTLEDDDTSEREVRFDLRYRRPMGERTSLRLGYSAHDERTANARVLTRMDRPDDPAPDSESRGLDQEQRLHAAYFNVQRGLAGQLALQVGLRAEQVAWGLGFPGAAPVDGSYFDVFPSVNLSWQHARAWRIRLSYSQRIGRPPARILDPTDRSRDPLERLVGNPGIEPRYSHRFHLNASWSGRLGTLALRPYVSRTVNSWERLTTVAADGVTTRTWDNLSASTRTGAAMDYSFRNLGRWRGSARASASRTYRDADNLDPRYSGGSTGWSARLSMNGPVAAGLTAQTSLRYTGASQSIQGRDGSRASADVSLRYRLAEDRLSISLALRDPFALQRTEREIRDLTVWEIQQSSRPTRSARLTLAYSLGGGGSGRADMAEQAR